MKIDYDRKIIFLHNYRQTVSIETYLNLRNPDRQVLYNACDIDDIDLAQTILSKESEDIMSFDHADVNALTQYRHCALETFVDYAIRKFSLKVLSVLLYDLRVLKEMEKNLPEYFSTLIETVSELLNTDYKDPKVRACVWSLAKKAVLTRGEWAMA